MKNKPLRDLEEIEKLYGDAVEVNMGLVLNDMQGNFENNSAAFLMSAHIGLHTVMACELMQAP